MKRKFKLHPVEYAAGQAERFYSGMAANGWILERRGRYFSRLRREEPQKLDYKAEPAGPPPYGEGGAAPRELKALYEAGGWSFVTRSALLCIFSAPAGTPLPEIPDDPAGRAALIKAMRRNAAAGFVVAALALFGIFMAANRGLYEEVLFAWYTDTAKVLFAAAVLALLLFDAANSMLHGAALYNRLRRGKPAGGGLPGQGGLRHAAMGLMLAACLGLALLAGAQLLCAETYDMPAAADGPYILLSELGWTGERTYSYQRDNVSEVTRVHSILSEQWHTREFVEEQPGGAVCTLRQEVYEFQSPEAAMALAAPLMKKGVFARDEGAYTKVEIAGLDGAWESPFEYVAVKGGTVYYLIYLDSSAGTSVGPKINILPTLAKILKYRQTP
ncbi:MAG TPA: DUF2812 domain-containing protein [Terriglobales bacterium]|nr:DUF2812 domain-containing protein [Terriglobales bacterium]